LKKIISKKIEKKILEKIGEKYFLKKKKILGKNEKLFFKIRAKKFGKKFLKKLENLFLKMEKLFLRRKIILEKVVKKFDKN